MAFWEKHPDPAKQQKEKFVSPHLLVHISTVFVKYFISLMSDLSLAKSGGSTPDSPGSARGGDFKARMQTALSAGQNLTAAQVMLIFYLSPQMADAC